MRIAKNVGGVDRVIRLIMGLLLLLLVPLALVGPRSSQAWLGLIGLPILLTGIFGYCIPYRWMGISTAKGCSPDEPDDCCRT
ncbi:MAG: YgaP-like transmembrane domain [Planctomycetota bacterium]